MFAVLSLCVVLAAQVFAANASCDMKNRFPGTCATNECCAMSAFPDVDIFCRPYPIAGEKCTTRNTPFICPCAEGLTCKPTVRADGSTSLHGKCA